jgi:hypothetical protein
VTPIDAAAVGPYGPPPSEHFRKSGSWFSARKCDHDWRAFSGKVVAGIPSEGARIKIVHLPEKWNGVSPPKMSTRNNNPSRKIRAARTTPTKPDCNDSNQRNPSDACQLSFRIPGNISLE